MRPTNHLDQLCRQASRRLLRLRSLVVTCRPPLKPEDHRALSYVTIEAWNLWAQYCRAYYLSTAFKAKDAQGSRVQRARTIASVDDALTVAIHCVRPKLRSRSGPWSHWDEPVWQKPSHFYKALDQFTPSNLATVRAALSYQTPVFREMQAARNYFAHKSENTAKLVRSLAPGYGAPLTVRPAELLCLRGPGRPQAILVDWLDDLRTVIELTV